jgi:hypothetical protein
MALQHECVNARTPGSGYHHSYGSGRGPAKCRFCGSAIRVTSGAYSVLAWRGDSGYSVADALATYATERAAEARRQKEDPSGEKLVVRFLAG